MMGDKKQGIFDQHGRKHDYLRISMIERCNLRCFYCMPEEGIQLRDKNEFMKPEEILVISKKFIAMGVKKIRLTGGEPLVRKGADIVIRELGKLPIELTMTTNGILVDKYIDLLKSSGMKKINVSLDSLKKEKFTQITRRDYFERVVSNIRLLLREGFEVKINVVAMKGINDDEIIDFVEWSRTELLHIRFIEFMPFDGNNWESAKKISYEEIMEKVNVAFGSTGYEKLDVKENATSRDFRLSNGIGTFGIISTVTNPFCDSCNRIRLTADGKIKNCLFSNDEMDILSEYRNNRPIDELIRTAMWKKHKERGGFENFDNETAGKMKNRSMVTIGG